MAHNPWEVAEAVLAVSPRVLMRGKPGTGKTYTAVHSGLREGQKVYQITMTPETPMAEIRGHFIQKGGEFVWHYGPGAMAWLDESGARLVINEIDRASEDVHSFLYALMDDPEFAETTLPNGEVIRPKPGFQVVCTMNGEPDDLPDALQDRLPVEIHITEVHPEAIDTLPEDLREAAVNTALAPTPERAISIRMWKEYASLREQLDPLLAAQAIFGPNAPAALAALAIAEDASPAIFNDGTEFPPELGLLLRDTVRYLFDAATMASNKAMAELSVGQIYQAFENRLLSEVPKPDPGLEVVLPEQWLVVELVANNNHKELKQRVIVIGGKEFMFKDFYHET